MKRRYRIECALGGRIGCRCIVGGYAPYLPPYPRPLPRYESGSSPLAVPIGYPSCCRLAQPALLLSKPVSPLRLSGSVVEGHASVHPPGFSPLPIGGWSPSKSDALGLRRPTSGRTLAEVSLVFESSCRLGLPASVVELSAKAAVGWLALVSTGSTDRPPKGVATLALFAGASSLSLTGAPLWGLLVGDSPPPLGQPEAPLMPTGQRRLPGRDNRDRDHDALRLFLGCLGCLGQGQAASSSRERGVQSCRSGSRCGSLFAPSNRPPLG